MQRLFLWFMNGNLGQAAFLQVVGRGSCLLGAWPELGAWTVFGDEASAIPLLAIHPFLSYWCPPESMNRAPGTNLMLLKVSES